MYRYAQPNVYELRRKYVAHHFIKNNTIINKLSKSKQSDIATIRLKSICYINKCRYCHTHSGRQNSASGPTFTTKKFSLNFNILHPIFIFLDFFGGKNCLFPHAFTLKLPTNNYAVNVGQVGLAENCNSLYNFIIFALFSNVVIMQKI